MLQNIKYHAVFARLFLHHIYLTYILQSLTDLIIDIVHRMVWKLDVVMDQGGVVVEANVLLYKLKT